MKPSIHITPPYFSHPPSHPPPPSSFFSLKDEKYVLTICWWIPNSYSEFWFFQALTRMDFLFVRSLPSLALRRCFSFLSLVEQLRWSKAVRKSWSTIRSFYLTFYPSVCLCVLNSFKNIYIYVHQGISEPLGFNHFFF